MAVYPPTGYGHAYAGGQGGHYGTAPISVGYGRDPTPVPAGCQRVHKIGRDDYGRRARIGGTMCFDAAGRGFIVDGSRYIVDYF